MAEIIEIPIEKIKVGEHDQRMEIEDESFEGLVASIGRLDLIYPLVVCGSDDGYILVEGHRRLAACKRLDKQTVCCVVEPAGRERASEIAFAGNFFRKDLSPVELACALKDCIENKTMTVKELAVGFHRSEHWVNSTVAIYGWPKDILEAIHGNQISVSAASNLACVTDDSYRAFLVRNAVEQGATARTTAAWLQAWRAMQPAEEAIEAEPVPGTRLAAPAVPQAPCFCCSQVFAVNEMSHVPVCGGCVQAIRQVGTSG